MGMDKKIISQKQLKGITDYDYCPFCLKAQKILPKTEAQKKLSPLFFVTTLEVVDHKTDDGETIQKKFFDNHYHCPNCNKDLTVIDFENVYTCRPDRSKWTEPPIDKDYRGA